LITKIHKVLKKHFEPVSPPADRPVLEHLLYACCLENAKFDHVDEVFAKLEQNYFDWNEVRVTTVAELAEVMALLPDAADAARRLKRALQSVFEGHYSFDLEFLKKQNLGKAIEHVEKFNGVSSFAVAYLTQHAFSGHSIPLSAAVYELLQLLGVITEAEAAKQRVPGLERAIPKNKGVEFGSLLHQLGVDYAATPHSPRVRTILLEITPDAKERLPRRTTKKDAEPAPAPPEPKHRAPSAAPPPRGASKAASPPPAEAEEEAADKSKAKSTSKRLARKKPR
jgi:endonuclease-3